MSPLDISVSFPSAGVIRLRSRSLFGRRREPDVPAVSRADFSGRGDLERHDHRGRCARRPTFIIARGSFRCAGSLNGWWHCWARARLPATSRPADGSEHVSTSGRIERRRAPRLARADARPASNDQPRASGVKVAPVSSLSLEDDDRCTILYYRQDMAVSDWQIKSELARPAPAEEPRPLPQEVLCQAIERELMGVLGIDRFSTNSITCTVLVHYDPHELTRAQVIEILDAALAGAEQPATLDKLDMHLPSARPRSRWRRRPSSRPPPLLPAAAVLYAYTSIPTLKEARRVLRRGEADRRRCARRGRDGRLPGNHVDLPGGRLLLVPELRPVSGQEIARQLAEAAVERLRQAAEIRLALPRTATEVQVPAEKLEKGDVIVVHTGEVVPVDGHVVEGMAVIDQHALTGESTPAEKGVGDQVFASTLLVAGEIKVDRRDVGKRDGVGQDRPDPQRHGGLQDVVAAQGRAAGRQGRAADPGRRCARDGHDGPDRGGRGAQQRPRNRHPHGRSAGDAQLADPLRQQGHPGQGRPGPRDDEPDRHGPLRQDRHADPRAPGGRPRDHRRRLGTRPDSRLRRGRRAEVPPSDRPGDPAQGRGAGARSCRRPTRPSTRSATASRCRSTAAPSASAASGSSRPRESRFPRASVEALDHAHHDGHTMVMVGVDDRLGGAIELQAAVRPEVREIIQGLRERGIKHIAIISGDHDAPTRKLAESLGMDRYFAQVLPADKADYVAKLQAEGCKVCFVGDGINDSIALKKADVSISLRGASSIATDTAQIVFLEGGLSKLCDLQGHRPRPRPQREPELVDDRRAQRHQRDRRVHDGLRDHDVGDHQQRLGAGRAGQRTAAAPQDRAGRGGKTP